MITPDNYTFFKEAKHNDEISKIIKSYINSTCSIYVKKGKEVWEASGFYIGSDIIVTAGHVAPSESVNNNNFEIKVSFDFKNWHTVSCIHSNENDFALLYLENLSKFLKPVKLESSENIEIGDIIAVLSSPEGFHHTATVGRVTNTDISLDGSSQNNAWNNIYFIDADIQQGSSGGLCINTDGKAIGSVIGIVGNIVKFGVGEHAVCPSSKILKELKNFGIV